MAAIESDSGAFMEKFALHPPTSSPQHLPLNGLTFAIKDIFDVKGYVTGFGNPDWAKTHLAAVSTASAVLALLNAGVTSVGKTVMDEMAYSLEGENIHYGRPINPCAPDQISGGSSSGSAVAVAAKLVDFSLGTDTGGSVNIPLGMYDNLPVAVSLLAKHGADGFLLNLVENLDGFLKEQIEITQGMSF